MSETKSVTELSEKNCTPTTVPLIVSLLILVTVAYPSSSCKLCCFFKNGLFALRPWYGTDTKGQCVHITETPGVLTKYLTLGCSSINKWTWLMKTRLHLLTSSFQLHDFIPFMWTGIFSCWMTWNTITVKLCTWKVLVAANVAENNAALNPERCVRAAFSCRGFRVDHFKLTLLW